MNNIKNLTVEEIANFAYTLGKEKFIKLLKEYIEYQKNKNNNA